MVLPSILTFGTSFSLQDVITIAKSNPTMEILNIKWVKMDFCMNQ
jgi:hypothetical protein